MTRISLVASGGLALAASLSPALAEEASTPALMDVIVVTGQRSALSAADVVTPDEAPLEGPDAARLVARLPGAALTNNGALSGQVQYRGLFGPRIAVRVDGQAFSSGGPSLMDPPLHYAPLPLVSHVEVDRGISPVRTGPGLAGGVNAVFKKVDFADAAGPEFHYDLTASGRTTDDSYALGGVAGAATDRWRFNALASYEEGDDIEFPGGTIRSSGHERLVYGLGAGFRAGPHEIGLDLRRHETDPTGNPPFPMDIRFVNTDFARLSYEGDLGFARLEAAFGYVDVSHAMNNFQLRPPPPDMMRYRETFADARTLTGEASLAFDMPAGTFRIGGDIEDVEHDARITNPTNAAFFVEAFPDIGMDRYGAFAEYTGDIAGWRSEVGVRLDRHETQAGEAALGEALPMGPRMIAAAFNAADRSWDGTTIDAVMRLWRDFGDALTGRLTLARKTRTPGYLERFAWLPITASGGLADGNTYVGDLALNPETAWIAEAGIDWQSAGAYARPTVFYRRIDDYIQGVPFDDTPGVIDTTVEMVSAMNGDPTPLRWANVDAELYGIDVDFGLRVHPHIRLDGVASYVRGKRRDIDVNLYRITPPNLTLAATYEQSAWSVTVESVLTAKQDHVSATNSEVPTDGYVLINLYGNWTVTDGVAISAGIENLFDKRYEEHLAGYNRVSDSDVALGERLPGPGRGVFLRVRLAR